MKLGRAYHRALLGDLPYGRPSWTFIVCVYCEQSLPAGA
jgi:hypothetical protein